ncbi:MAG: hypothetical protein U0163_12785 [Gemmatimonadaceae bacterium]
MSTPPSSAISTRWALAGVALGNLYWLRGDGAGAGTIMALDPLVAQAVGARDDVAIARSLQRGVCSRR